MLLARRGAVPAPLLVVAAMVSAQVGSALARTLFDALSPMGVLFLRQSLGAVILIAIARPRLGSWTRTQWTATAVYGAALAGMNASFYASIQRIPLGLAVTLEYLGPLLLALTMSRRARDAGWALLAGSGVALIGWSPDGAAAWSGYLLAMLAGAFWVVYILVTKRIGATFAGIDGLGVALAVAALLTAPSGFSGATQIVGDADLVVRALTVALLSSVIVYCLEVVALRRLPSRVFSVLLSLSPAVAAIAGVVILHQLLSPVQSMGLALVSIASAAVAAGGRGPGKLQPQD